MSSTAPGTVVVISTTGIPPCITASAAKCASSPDETLTAGTMAISRIRAQTSSFFMCQNPFVMHKRLLYGVICISFRETIIAAGQPCVQGWQQEDADEQTGNQTSYNHDGERSLRI